MRGCLAASDAVAATPCAIAPNAQVHRRRAFLRRPVERLVGPERLRYPATCPREQATRRLAGPQHGRLHFGFGRRSWAIQFPFTIDDCDNAFNAFAVSALMLLEGQDRNAARATLGNSLAVSAFPLYVPV